MPVTALACNDHFLFVAEGPFLRLFRSSGHKLIGNVQIFKSQSIHGIRLHCEGPSSFVVLIWGGALIRALNIRSHRHSVIHDDATSPVIELSSTLRAPDWILGVEFNIDANDPAYQSESWTCAAITAHNALLGVKIQRQYPPNQDLGASDR